MKTFPASVVFSAATGLLYCDIGEIYAVYSHMANADFHTLQLPGAFSKLSPQLIAANPDLCKESPPDMKDATNEARAELARAFADKLQQKYGDIEVPTVQA